MAKRNGVLNWKMVSVFAALGLAILAGVFAFGREVNTNTADIGAIDKRVDHNTGHIAELREVTGDIRDDVAWTKAGVEILLDNP